MNAPDKWYMKNTESAAIFLAYRYFFYDDKKKCRKHCYVLGVLSIISIWAITLFALQWWLDYARRNTELNQAVDAFGLIISLICFVIFTEKSQDYQIFQGRRPVGSRIYNFWQYLQKKQYNTEFDIKYLLDASKNYDDFFAGSRTPKIFSSVVAPVAVSLITNVFTGQLRQDDRIRSVIVVFIFFFVFSISIGIGFPYVDDVAYDRYDSVQTFWDDLHLIKTFVQDKKSNSEIFAFCQERDTQPIQRMQYLEERPTKRKTTKEKIKLWIKSSICIEWLPTIGFRPIRILLLLIFILFLMSYIY